jgi:hypothetical protein
LSEHDTPVPVQPTLQAHVNEANVLVQAPLAWQLWTLDAHSSASAHSTPVPV